MAVNVGDKAPDFTAKDQNGETISLSNYKGKTVILYFYPKDDTPGCTATSCNLRDEYSYLISQNYKVVGVSADDERSHLNFANKYQLPFPLIADVGLEIIKAYDVWGPKMIADKIFDGIIRTTFVIDPQGMLKKVITEVDKENHARQIIEA